MDISFLFFQIALILVLAKVFSELATYLTIPAVLGELLLGIILGPSLLNIIDISLPMHLLAQIGIVLLLFEVGLETDFTRLKSCRVQAGLVAVAGVVFPLLSAYYVSYYFFELSFLSSLFVSSSLTATSIGITLRVLSHLKKQNSDETQIILGAAILDDIIGIILLTLLYDFSIKGQVNVLSVGQTLLLLVLFLVLSPIAIKYLIPSIKTWDTQSPNAGFIPTLIFSLILLFSWMAHSIGAPELLGGFTVGLALSPQFMAATLSPTQSISFSHKVHEQIKPLIQVLTPIFFVSIGLSLNLQSINWSSSFIWVLTSLLFIVAVLGKLLAGFLLQKEKFKTKLIVGSAMIPRGEVGLIFANIGMSAGVLSNELYASLILVIALTTLLAPLALAYLYSYDDLPLANPQ